MTARCRPPTQAEIFDRRVSYETFRDAVELDGTALADRVAHLINHAIEQQRRGREKVVSTERTRFFADFASLAQENDLPFRAGPERGITSGFFVVHGWETVAGHKAKLVAKFGREHKAVDIQISGAGHITTLLQEDLAAHGLSSRSTSKGTLIIHRDAPHLNPDEPLAAQQENAELFIFSARHLIDWWAEYGKTLVGRLIAES